MDIQICYLVVSKAGFTKYLELGSNFLDLLREIISFGCLEQ